MNRIQSAYSTSTGFAHVFDCPAGRRILAQTRTPTPGLAGLAENHEQTRVTNRVAAPGRKIRRTGADA